MPTAKTKSKPKSKKPAPRKIQKKTPPTKSAAKSAAVTKKSVKKKTVVTKKTSAKKIAKKMRVKKPVQPKFPDKTVIIEPGPPPSNIPPVEEPVQNETAIAVVTHYYSHLNVAVIQMNTGTLGIGDTIRIKGLSTDFMQSVESMEYERQHVSRASAGQRIGIKVIDHAREHDIVYRVK